MSEFKVPPAHLGQIVLWRTDPTSEPSPAIISAVNTRNVCLHIFSKYNAVPLLRDGVFHISDPQALRQGNKDAGVWEHVPTFGFIEEPGHKPDLTPLHGLKGGKK